MEDGGWPDSDMSFSRTFSTQHSALFPRVIRVKVTDSSSERFVLQGQGQAEACFGGDQHPTANQACYGT